VYLPPALARKYPSASREFCGQYVFPGRNLSCDLQSGAAWQHHALEYGLQKAVKAAMEKAGIRKRVSCHVFCHAYAGH
jgi:integrase